MTERRSLHDPFASLAGDAGLRRADRRFHAERRAEAEAYEALLAKAVARSQTVSDVARQWCRRGDEVEVQTPTAAFRGRIVAVGSDVVCVRAPVGMVDVALTGNLALRVIERSASGGSEPHSPLTFRARLAEHETAGTPLRVGTTLPLGDLQGWVEVVARDHIVVVADGHSHYVGMAAVTFTLAATDVSAVD